MLFDATPIAGVVRVRIERREDERGFFARTYCDKEFAAAGLASCSVQSSISYNRKAGTVRGMHFQWPPSREAKLVRCVHGGIFDVALDLRPDSKTFKQHVAFELRDDSRDALYIAPGLAHGFQTLTTDAEVLYQMSDFYAPQLAAGVRWNDPAFGIQWPVSEVTIVDRDREYPNFDNEAHARAYANALARHS